MINFFIFLLVAYLTLVVVMAVFQRQLMYFPDTHIGAPSQYGLMGFGEHFIKTQDNLQLQLWYKPAREGMPTVMYFHGNASHIGNRAGILSALAGKGFGVAALSYRGYGKSQGQPSEQGLYDDARAAFAFLLDGQHLAPAQIVIYGESLGTGVSVQMAGEYAVGALVLQAPYTAVTDRAAEIYFYVPVKWLISDHYDSLSKIAKIKAPLLIFHGEQDTTIPITHGQKLFDTATSVKESVYFPDVAHNNFDSAVIAEHVLAFVRKQGIAQ